MNKKMKISLILGGMCVALSCGIAIQVRTISRIGTTTSRNSTENELRDAILRTKENYDNLYANEEKAEKLLEDERKSATENNSELAEIQENIKIIIECKSEKIEASNSKDGVAQLKSYMSACANAEWGMWTNSKEKFVFKKYIDDSGSIQFMDIMTFHQLMGA